MKRNINSLKILFLLLPFICSCSNEGVKMLSEASEELVDECLSENRFCVRVATYNVAVGQFASASEIAAKLAPLDLDVLALTECPTLIDPNSEIKDFVEIIADEINMPYWKLGSISAGNHWKEWGTDKSGNYHGKLRAILSKTKLVNAEEVLLQGTGWKQASVLRAETLLNENEFAIYSLHIPGSNHEVEGSVHQYLADRIISEEIAENFLVMGDFNDSPSDLSMQYVFSQGMSNALDDLENLAQRIDDFPPGRIDHILYNTSSNALAIDGYSIYAPSFSDHPYVWCQLLY